jgi:CheY-like chemotaxis protein
MAEILIIDDDPGALEVMTAALQSAGHRVREAGDGIGGLALFRQHRPEIVVTDMVMPGKEGVEVIRQLRREDPNIAILAVSGVVNSRFYLHVATQFGADAILAKPFRPDDLIDAVSELLNPPLHAA